MAPLALRTRINRGLANWLQDDRRWLPNGSIGLGPLGDFPPAVQFYSCPLSPWWASTALLAVGQGADHAFWQQEEPVPTVKNLTRYVDGPGIVMRQRAFAPSSEATLSRAELVPCKVRQRRVVGDPDYLRLWYDSQLPWAAGDPETGMVPGGLALWLDKQDTWLQPLARISGGMHAQVIYSRFLFSHADAVDCALIAVEHGWLVALRPRSTTAVNYRWAAWLCRYQNSSR